MKIKAYGYYNYSNTHDQREHLTLTPIKTVERSDGANQLSGNVYAFEVNKDLEYKTYTDPDTKLEFDHMRYSNGGVDVTVIIKDGDAYLTPLNPDYRDPAGEIWLGTVKSHIIKS